jgi:hypothetical protein
MADEAQTLADLPIACSLSQEEQAARHEELTNGISKAVQQVRELADGYAFRFPGEAGRVAQLTEFILTERACCPFFTFELTFEPNRGPIWLRLRGGAGVKEFIQGWAIMAEMGG